MLLSFLKKSKSLIGIGEKVEGVKSDSEENTTEQGTIATEDDDDDSTMDKRLNDLKFTVYDHIRRIKDPEKPNTLEDLDVVFEDGIQIRTLQKNKELYIIRVEFNPTVPHCSLATLIGLCIRVKLQRSLTENYKLDIYIKKGAHNTEDEINKQINDKERIAAAMENPNLKTLVEECIKEED
ncbi:hypothetical protein B566_EDAN001444 [Ephemera danica]|nr:hypothetical protein B566_EDAN001444 [Ephemera danica]